MMFIYRLAVMTSTAARMAQRQKSLAVLSRGVAVGAALSRRVASLERDWLGSADGATAHAMLVRAITAIQAEAGLFLPVEQAAAAPDTKLSAQQRLLLDLVEADSAAIIHHGNITRIGDAPSNMAIYAIASMFGRELPDLRRDALAVYATDSLASVVPAAADIKECAAGVMAASLSADTPSYLLWFRREQIVHATWAGNPAADAMSAGSEGLNPRASFEAWKQDIRNLSRPWLLEDVEVAHELAMVLRSIETDGEPAPVSAPTDFSRAPASWPTPALASSGAMGEPAMADFARPAQPPRRVIRIGQR